MSLSDRIINLRLLLQSKSFERWPLHVRFFEEDAHRIWQGWKDESERDVRQGIRVFFENCQQPNNVAVADSVESPEVPRGIYKLDVGYGAYTAQLEKSNAVLAKVGALICHICKRNIAGKDELAVVCHSQGCEAVTHVSCLASLFLRQESNDNSLIPTSGRCPSCGSKQEWRTLMLELSLRLRGAKEVQMLTRKRRGRRTKEAGEPTAIDPVILVEQLDQSVVNDEDADARLSLNELDEALASDSDLDDDWMYRNTDPITTSWLSTDGFKRQPSASPKLIPDDGRGQQKKILPIVIEDSEDSDAGKLSD
jgi:structure-specific endonuclease subunit SLX1